MGNVTQLRTRKPTGAVAWPLILLAGEAKSGKSFTAASLTGDPRVGRSLWLDLGEGCADEYIAVPGADYDILEHDGTWTSIVASVEAARDFAREELKAGKNPVVLIIDSMTAEWAMLGEWANKRAKRSKSNQQKLSRDPDAEIDVTMNLWNDANSRHHHLMGILKSFPGIVVMTALEAEKTQMGPGGQPTTAKVLKPDCQKRVSADATVWVRLSLTEAPVIVGIRSVRVNIQPGIDKPLPLPDFSLAKLVFDQMGVKVGSSEVRDIPPLDADQAAPGEKFEAPDPPAVDWDAAMKDCGSNREAWLALHAKAPAELKERIRVAASAAISAAKKPEAAEGSPAPTSIARPTKLEKGRTGSEMFDALLDCSDFAKAEEMTRTAPRVDVTSFLTGDIREVLAIEESAHLKLPEFAQTVADYINRRKVSVNAAINGEAA